MGSYERRFWESTVGGIGVPRKDRAAGWFEAFIPDRLTNRAFTIEGDVAADVADAERSIAGLDATAQTLTDTEGLARLLLRAESVASSHIEGLRVSPQRLMRRAAGYEIGDATANDVLANVDAMTFALEDRAGRISIPRIVEVHRRLLASSKQAQYAGQLRAEQNWIGGNDFNPLGAAFVPPPPEYVYGLLEDLCTFCNDDALPTVVQAAIAHAQFETIHPFVDGNGRTGRALIYMVLRRRGLAVRTTPPISLVLATQARTYVNALDATRVEGPPERATSALNRWTAIFAVAARRAVDDAQSFERTIAALQTDWLRRLEAARSDSGARLLMAHLCSMPILSVEDAARVLGRAYSTANDAIEKLVAAKILTPIDASRRHRRFEAREVLDAFTALERRLASPAADTRIAKPVRDVPARPKLRPVKKK